MKPTLPFTSSTCLYGSTTPTNPLAFTWKTDAVIGFDTAPNAETDKNIRAGVYLLFATGEPTSLLNESFREFRDDRVPIPPSTETRTIGKYKAHIKMQRLNKLIHAGIVLELAESDFGAWPFPGLCLVASYENTVNNFTSMNELPDFYAYWQGFIASLARFPKSYRGAHGG